MGVKHSRQSSDLALSLAETPIVNHPKFRQIRLFKNDDIVRIIVAVQNESDYQQWTQRLNKVTNLDDEVILLPKFYNYHRKAICGSSGNVEIDFQFYQYVLAEEIKNRQKVNRYFQQPQIWYLLYCLVTAAHDFQKINQKIGDIRPQNIFINQVGHVKVANLFSWPGEVTNYIKTVYDNQITYLSPQQANSARQGKSQTFINKFKAESFSIGLTVLQAATIQDMYHLYLPNKTFDISTFNMIMANWWQLRYKSLNQQSGDFQERVYSQSLRIAVAALLQINVDDRWIADEVYKWLRQFHKQINQLTEFEPGLPPIKNIDRYRQYLENNPFINNQHVQNHNIRNLNSLHNQTNNVKVHAPYMQFQKYVNPAQKPQPRNYPPPQFHTFNPAQVIFNTNHQNNISDYQPNYHITPNITPQRPITIPNYQQYPTSTTSTFTINNATNINRNTQQFLQNNPQQYQSAFQPSTNAFQSSMNTFQPSSNAFQPSTNLDNNSDFLKKIDEQIQRSKQGYN